MDKLFDRASVLTSMPIKSTLDEYSATDLRTVLDKECNSQSFKVFAVFMNRIAFGRYDNSELELALGKLDERFLLELRLFNDDKEVLIIKDDEHYKVRVIDDIDGSDIDAVDTLSNFFGERCENGSQDGYVMLKEPGRKISMLIPADILAKHYALKTRSYITYDDDTMQAGFSYYRYVSIEAGKE